MTTSIMNNSLKKEFDGRTGYFCPSRYYDWIHEEGINNKKVISHYLGKDMISVDHAQAGYVLTEILHDVLSNQLLDFTNDPQKVLSIDYKNYNVEVSSGDGYNRYDLINVSSGEKLSRYSCSDIYAILKNERMNSAGSNTSSPVRIIGGLIYNATN